MLILGPHQPTVLQLVARFKAEYQIKDIGTPSQYLGTQVLRDWTSRTIHLHQTNYTLDLLAEYQMSEFKPIETPMSKTDKISPAADGEVTCTHLFRAAIGSLTYLVTLTRPDLACAVNILSRFSNCYTDAHWI